MEEQKKEQKKTTGRRTGKAAASGRKPEAGRRRTAARTGASGTKTEMNKEMANMDMNTGAAKTAARKRRTPAPRKIDKTQVADGKMIVSAEAKTETKTENTEGGKRCSRKEAQDLYQKGQGQGS